MKMAFIDLPGPNGPEIIRLFVDPDTVQSLSMANIILPSICRSVPPGQSDAYQKLDGSWVPDSTTFPRYPGPSHRRPSRLRTLSGSSNTKPEQKGESGAKTYTDAKRDGNEDNKRGSTQSKK